jgi:protein SCO1
MLLVNFGRPKLMLAMVVFALFFSISASSQTGGKRYKLNGEVISKKPAAGEIIVKHGDIPGFMAAMTMPYQVTDRSVLQELQPGDKITAVVVVKGDDYWLENVRITDRSGRKTAKAPVPSHLLAVGEPVPDLPLTNQDGKTIHFRDFAGKAVLLTFIYTRCPLPNFCPRLTSQFAKIHDHLKKTPEELRRTHLLTITFDPKYDSSAVLRKYGLAYLDGDATGFAHWDFASTSPAELRLLSYAFGLDYIEEDNQISHTMNIVLIAPDGTVAKSWSTEWTAAELEQALRAQAGKGSASVQTAADEPPTQGRPSPARPPRRISSAGQELFVIHCAACHEDERPDLRKQPPKLDGLFQSKTLPSGAPATDAQVRKTIIRGRRTMPAFDQRLSEQDVEALVGYLHTLNSGHP